MEPILLKPDETVFTEKRATDYRGEVFEYVHIGILDANGDMWTTTELDEINLGQILNQYRLKHHIPSQEEIIKIREHYGLSHEKMSLLLGLGINQYRYYEEGELPTIEVSKLLKEIHDKNVFLQLLESKRNIFTEEEFQRIYDHVSSLSNFTYPN